MWNAPLDERWCLVHATQMRELARHSAVGDAMISDFRTLPAKATLGVRTMDPEQLSQLVEDKFVDALRAAAVAMTMQELLDKRQDATEQQIEQLRPIFAADSLSSLPVLKSTTSTRAFSQSVRSIRTRSTRP